MPTYEYRCRSCHKKFSALLSYQNRDQAVCPECGKKDCEQLITSFGFIGGGGSSGGTSSGCGPGGFT